MDTVVNKIRKEGQFEFEISGKRVILSKNHLIVKRQVPEGWHDVEFNHGVIYLSKERTDELDAEGFARELMRRIQSLRKKSALIKTDKIDLNIEMNEKMKSFLDDWSEIIKEKVGASTISYNERKFQTKEQLKIKDQEFEISFKKV